MSWSKKVKAAGLPAGLHFHELWPPGNHLASLSGASTRELMHRMGHASMRAALIYQHATDARARQIAEHLSKAVEDTLNGTTNDDSDDLDDGSAGVPANVPSLHASCTAADPRAGATKPQVGESSL